MLLFPFQDYWWFYVGFIVFVFFILAVAAAEAAIGLAIVMLLYRNKGNLSMLNMNLLKG